MHLMQMNKPKLAALLEQKLPARHRNLLHEDGASLDVCGVFVPPGAGNWYLGVRVLSPRRKTLNVRIHESRVGIALSIFATANFLPFDWAHFAPANYLGDKPERNERLHRRVKRSVYGPS